MDSYNHFKHFVSTHREALAALAYVGYQHKGRGVLLLFFDGPDVNSAIGDDSENIGMAFYGKEDKDKVAARGVWPVNGAEKEIETYDPETQVVVLAIYGETDFHLDRIGPFPMKQLEVKFAKATNRNSN